MRPLPLTYLSCITILVLQIPEYSHHLREQIDASDTHPYQHDLPSQSRSSCGSGDTQRK